MANQSNLGHSLAIVNEHDPVTRADDGYIKCITNMYNQFGGAGASTTSSAAPVASSDPGPSSWPFPAQDLHNVGDLIVLKDTSTEAQKEIHAFRVTPEEFGLLIFCDRNLHKKVEYLDNVKKLPPLRDS